MRILNEITIPDISVLARWRSREFHISEWNWNHFSVVKIQCM